MSSGVAIYEAVDDGRDFVFKDLNEAGLKSGHLQRQEVAVDSRRHGARARRSWDCRRATDG